MSGVVGQQSKTYFESGLCQWHYEGIQVFFEFLKTWRHAVRSVNDKNDIHVIGWHIPPNAMFVKTSQGRSFAGIALVRLLCASISLLFLCSANFLLEALCFAGKPLMDYVVASKL
jgi:hypothetical protein